MKKVFVVVASCALFAPLAFGLGSKQKTKTATERGVIVTGTIVTTVEEGSAANYQPPKTLVIREDRSSETGRYVLNGPGRIVNKKGEIIRTAIQPGAHVRVFFASAGGVRTIDHVVVD